MALQHAKRASVPAPANDSVSSEIAAEIAARIHAIGAGNRHDFTVPLHQMFADRKTVFVDYLRWDLPVTDGVLEIDEYDREDSIYLMVQDAADGAHLGSVRLLPTVESHLLGDKFARLCEEGVPRGSHIFEITRMLTRPGLPPAAAMQVRRQLAIAIVEFALSQGIRQFTMMTHMQFLSAVMAMGWECEPLGMPQQMDGVDVAALLVSVDATTLEMFRTQWNIGEPLLRFLPSEIGTGGVSAF